MSIFPISEVCDGMVSLGIESIHVSKCKGNKDTEINNALNSLKIVLYCSWLYY